MNLNESPCRLCLNKKTKECLHLKCEKLYEYQKESNRILLEGAAIDTEDEFGYKIVY
jgi:hypothetical protein